MSAPPGQHAHRWDTSPVQATCPLQYLAGLVSAPALLHAHLWCRQPPRTIADVATGITLGTLTHIQGLGPRRAGEIELALTLAGLLTAPPAPPSPGTSHNLPQPRRTHL